MANAFPIVVTGYISPYPTVRRVEADHHMPEKAFLKASGWASCSTEYMQRDEATMRINIITQDEMSWFFLSLRTLVMTLNASYCVFILNNLNILMTRSSLKATAPAGKNKGR